MKASKRPHRLAALLLVLILLVSFSAYGATTQELIEQTEEEQEENNYYEERLKEIQQERKIFLEENKIGENDNTNNVTTNLELLTKELRMKLLHTLWNILFSL